MKTSSNNQARASSGRLTSSGRLVRAAALALFIGVTACKAPSSCGDQTPTVTSDDPAQWAEQTALSGYVPKTARTVVFARDFTTMAESLSFASDRLPHPTARDLEGAFEMLVEVDDFYLDPLQRAGLASTKPAVLFYDRGHWTIGAGLEEPARLDRSLEKARSMEGLEAKSVDFGSLEAEFLTRTEDDQTRSMFVARDERLALFSVPVDADVDYQAPRLPESWLSTSDRPRFLEDADHRELLAQMTSSGKLVGVVRPAAWFAGQRGDDHAAVLRQRLLGQIGAVGFGASSVSLDDRIDLKVFLPGKRQAPVMVSELGQAEGDLPPLGGLIEPGVLGVARLSVSPENLYELFTSALPARKRNELVEVFDKFDEELRVNFERDLIGNLRGHAVVVAYGLRREAFESEQTPWLLELVKLEATREAVLLPILEREPVEQVLDAMTTVTKSKLSRQQVGHTLQYAWMVDGELKWALILSDEHLIVVDSAAAFEHARAFEERGGALGSEFEGSDLGRLFTGDHEAGFYIDTASVTEILAESDHTEAISWLESFESAVVTTYVEDGVGKADITLDIGRRHAAGESDE